MDLKEYMTDKPIKVIFDPGFFENFEGTQEELDEFVAEITKVITQELLDQDMDLEDLIPIDEEEIEQCVKELKAEMAKKLH